MRRCAVVIGGHAGHGLCRWRRRRAKVAEDTIDGGAGLPTLGKARISLTETSKGLERGGIDGYLGCHWTMLSIASPPALQFCQLIFVAFCLTAGSFTGPRTHKRD